MPKPSCRTMFASALGTIFPALALVASASTQPPSGEPLVTRIPADATYTGTASCVECHREQTDTWVQTIHANAFTILPPRYRSDPTCLECHVTAYGEAGGYVQGTSAEILNELLGVGCEACHGPGSAHEKAVRGSVELLTLDEAEMA